MATATSNRRRLAPIGLALVAALAIAGCGGGARPGPQPTVHAHAQVAGPFAWLSPAAPPAGWQIGRLPSGSAALAYPPGWRPIRTDPGTFSAALLGPHGKIRGYLNATPRQGAETLADWARFRTAHNRDEGDFNLVSEAAARGLRFRTGSGSCVIDRYATDSAHYREIACLVRGSRASTVVVAAALPRDWPRLAPELERAVSSFAS
jgi:hypothetical protein